MQRTHALHVWMGIFCNLQPKQLPHLAIQVNKLAQQFRNACLVQVDVYCAQALRHVYHVNLPFFHKIVNVLNAHLIAKLVHQSKPV